MTPTVAGEAGHDDPLVRVGGEQAGQHRTHLALAIGVALLLGVGRIGQEQPDPGPVGQGSDPGQIGGPPVNGRQVDLEIPGVQDDALGRVEGGGEAVGHRMGDGNELHIEGPDHPSLAVANRNELGSAQQAGFFDAAASQAQSQLGSVDGE